MKNPDAPGKERSMRMVTKTRVGWVLTALGVALLAGCSGTNTTPLTTIELPNDLAEIRIEGGAGLVVVTVESGAKGELRADARHRLGAPSDDDAYTLANGVLTLRTGCGQSCRIDYHLKIGAPVRVTGENGSGTVLLTGVDEVDVTTGSGVIAVAEARAAVTVRSGSGSLQVEGSPPEVSARSGSGSVRLALTSPGEAIVTTGSGDVDIAVPEEPRELDVKTSSGKQDVTLSHSPSGEGSITVTTGSGDVRIRQS